MPDQKPSVMGGTFAERLAAARGDKTFKAPVEELPEPQENSTFADRSKAGKGSKAVKADDAENKAVKSAASKTAAKKS